MGHNSGNLRAVGIPWMFLRLRCRLGQLMKLLKLDSSLSARKQLAQELGYTGALDGSAEMNVWLHKQVMTKLAESGGKVPDSLRA